MSTEVLREVIAIQRHASVPARIKGLREENAVAGSNHRLLVHGIRKAEAWRKPLLPGPLRIVLAVAGVSTT